MSEYLYRYERFTSDHSLKTIARLFDKNELYLNSRLQFNDPFDSHPFLSGEITQDDILMSLSPSEQISEDEKRERLKGKDTNKIFEEYFYDRIFNKIGIKSFSEKVDSISLWGNYADSNKGYCIEFKKIDSEITKALEVSYQVNRPIINKRDFLTNEDFFTSELAKSLLIKSLHWQHEKEHRISFHGKAFSYIKVNPKEITAIYFGCECDVDYIDLMKRYTENRNIALYKCRKHSAEYKLIFEPLG